MGGFLLVVTGEVVDGEEEAAGGGRGWGGSFGRGGRRRRRGMGLAWTAEEETAPLLLLLLLLAEEEDGGGRGGGGRRRGSWPVACLQWTVAAASWRCHPFSSSSSSFFACRTASQGGKEGGLPLTQRCGGGGRGRVAWPRPPRQRAIAAAHVVFLSSCSCCWLRWRQCALVCACLCGGWMDGWGGLTWPCLLCARAEAMKRIRRAGQEVDAVFQGAFPGPTPHRNHRTLGKAEEEGPRDKI